jgi:diaminopimelate decarboxylase
LRFAGHVLAALAGWHGTPLYLYDAARVTENSVRLRAALTTRALPFRIF